MDVTDFRILGHLLRRPLDGAEDVARAVGLTRNAVARRIRILAQAPVRLRFFAIPHFSLFGARSTVALFPTSGKIDSKALLAIDDVIAFDLNHDGLVASTFWSFGKERALPAEMGAVLGAPSVAQFKDATPAPRVPHLSRLEWKVLRAVVADPRASAATLARKCGLTAKTCSRHRKALIQNHAIVASMSILEDKSQGFPVYRLYIQGQPDPNRVDELLGKDSITTDVVEEGHVRFAHAPTFGEILGVAEKVRRLPAVSDVKLILSRDSDVATEKFLRLIDEKVADPKSRPTFRSI